MNNKPGIFITFEGVEGSGKSVQTNFLYNELHKKGYNVYLTREPGGTDAGKGIRDILLNTVNEINSYTELFLYLADRSQHIVEVIKPYLLQGAIVISDRFFDSTIAYQKTGRRIPKEEIEEITDFKIFKELEPDLTFLLDLAPEFAQERVENPDRIERENIEFHTRVRNAYIELARMNPERIFVIDALDSIENISNIIKRTTLDLIKEVNYE